MATPLSDIPTKELRAEIARRDEETRQQKLAEHAEHECLVTQHVEVLLAFAPEHERTSCTDANYANYHGRCLRCALLYAAKHVDFPHWLRLHLEAFER